MRVKIRLHTMSDIYKFINTTSLISEDVTLEDGTGFRVSAKSLLGGMYAMEFANIYCCCERDISGSILEWVV